MRHARGTYSFFKVIQLASALSFCAVSAHAQTCQLIQTVDTGTALSSEVLDEISVINADVRPIEFVSRITDITGDGVKEVLTFEAQNRVAIRDGVSLAIVPSGAFPFQLPNGAIPTQMGLIGDLGRDGVEEIGIGVRYVGATAGDSVFVFDGASRTVLERFPSNIVRLPQKFNPDEPLYPTAPAVSRVGASVQVAEITGEGRTLLFSDPQFQGGAVLFKSRCTSDGAPSQCFDIRTLHNANIAPHNLGAKMIGFETGAGREVFLLDPSADSLPIILEGITDVRKNLAGAVVRFSGSALAVYRRGDLANGRFGFDAIVPSNTILGQSTFLASSPTDGISPSDTAEFFVVGVSGAGANRRFTPQLTEENIDLGYSIDGGDDLTTDGAVDVVVGAPGEENEGRVRIYTPGSDYFNRAILRVAGPTIRFGHSVASVGAGRLVVADATGKLYALAVSGGRVASLQSTLCAAPQPDPTPTPQIGVSNAELTELVSQASRISKLVGSLKYQQGRSGSNRNRLDSIKRTTDRVSNALKSETLIAREPRFNATYRRDFMRRADDLQKRFKSGSRSQRRDAQKRLTSKANQMVLWANAAMAR